MIDLLRTSELPEGFEYPPEFRRVIDLGLVDLEPWLILEGAQLRSRYEGLRLRYPARSLLPFARRQDNDDVACWDLAQGNGRVVIIHDFADPGWEGRVDLNDFNSWLRQAVEDLIEFR